MKSIFGTKYLFFPIIITLFLLIPENVVWGGQSFQTVPTIGPSPTPTRTLSITATQPASTGTPMNKPTSTPVLITPVAASATFTAEATRSSLSATSEPQKTESISATDDPSPPDNTSVVILPVVSNGDSLPGEQSSQESNKPIPAFVFPLVVVLLFVIIYLSTRWSLKKPQDEIQPK
jgi:cobalamin biosynthesis Mg chelatase CobN